MRNGFCLTGIHVGRGVGRLQVSGFIDGLCTEIVNLVGGWWGEDGTVCPRNPVGCAFGLIFQINLADAGVGVCAGGGDQVEIVGEGVNGRYR